MTKSIDILASSRPSREIRRVAGFMSGSGTNLVKIIEHEQELKAERGVSPYHVAVIFSDNAKSKATEIGARFGIPNFVYDLEGFCAKRGKPVKDLELRKVYEAVCMKVLSQFDCEIAAYAGYMRKATEVFVDSFLGVNVHPADLTIKGENGKPKYRGDHAVRDAIQAREKEIRSTTHLVSRSVDCGQILMVSPPVQITYPIADTIINQMADAYQKALKEKGDWAIFPKTLEYLAEGRFGMSEGEIYFDTSLVKPVPNGVRLD